MVGDAVPAWAEELRLLVMERSDAVLARDEALEAALTARVDTFEATVKGRVDTVAAATRERIGALEAAVMQRVDTLEAATTERIGALEAAVMQRVDTVEAAVVQRVDTLEAAILERVDREVRRPLIEHIDTRTAAIMDRIDRLQTRVDSHADAIRVNLAAAQLARGKAVEMDETLLHREVARTQEMRVMNDMMEAMQRQIGRLEADLRDLRGRA